MEEDEQRRVGGKGLSKFDWLSNLPNSLLCKILLNLPTKDVVKCSVLSKTWRTQWRYVPGFELDERIFPDYKTFVSFVDTFLGFNTESYLESFKLNYYGSVADYYGFNGEVIGDYEPEIGIVTRWINTVVDRRVKHLVFVDDSVLDWYIWDVQMPPTLYTCESLVSLKLGGVTLATPTSVSLPCLKVMVLTMIHVTNVLDLETLISHCPVLESLFIERSLFDGIRVLRVCSQSLLSFTHISKANLISSPLTEDDLIVETNAPKLQCLRLRDYPISSFTINNASSLVEANIDTVFTIRSENYFDPNDLEQRKMVRSFLEGISCVKDMTITSKSLEVFYHYSRREQLPLFRNLSFLSVSFRIYKWKMFPIFLESCPNLKSLVMASHKHRGEERLSTISRPRCVLLSLEFVAIETPLRRKPRDMKLVSYFLENSAIHKKLTIRLNASITTEQSAASFKDLLAIPSLSSSCQVIVL